MNYLKENHYFGMKEGQVTITKQDVVPSVINLQGELAVDANGHLLCKPHGHGDIHFCLYRVSHSLNQSIIHSLIQFNHSIQSLIQSFIQSFIGPNHQEVDRRIGYSLSLLLPGHKCPLLLYHDLYCCDCHSRESSHGQYMY